MKILIVYATYSSGTLTTSEIIMSELQQNAHEVTVVNVADIDPIVFNQYDLILLGSPSWWNDNQDGMPHHLFLHLFKKMEGMTVTKNFAVFGLGDSAYARVCGSVDHLEEFVHKIKGQLVMESLRVDSFYFDREKNDTLIKEWAGKLSKLT